MSIVFVGIDLAKNVFAVHGVDEAGKPALVRPTVARAKLHELIASLPTCTVAMEACTGAHHWARLFTACGHTIRLIAPKFVAPYRMSGLRAAYLGTTTPSSITLRTVLRSCPVRSAMADTDRPC